MSMKGISSSAEPDKLSKRLSTHKRNDAHSGELDVFEASVYFSGYNEVSSGDYRNTQKYGYNAREENRRRWGILGGGRRISLDLPIRCSEQVHHLYQDHHEKQEVTTIKERLGSVKHKQPSSPGGKIASFLNSLFHQTGSKKSKSKSKPTPTDREVEEENTPGGGWMRRRRRSSMSHFLSSSKSNSTTTTTTTTTTSSSSKSLLSSSSSGFRTPPPYLNTPTKNYKQFLNFTSATNQMEVVEVKKSNEELSWLDEKLKVMEKQKVFVGNGDDDDRGIIKRNGEEEDDGMESDSSSDLFELQNYELSRGGLPVYETTNVANINNTHI